MFIRLSSSFDYFLQPLFVFINLNRMKSIFFLLLPGLLYLEMKVNFNISVIYTEGKLKSAFDFGFNNFQNSIIFLPLMLVHLQNLSLRNPFNLHLFEIVLIGQHNIQNLLFHFVPTYQLHKFPVIKHGVNEFISFLDGEFFAFDQDK